MTNNEVNELTKEYILLEDEVYLGNVYKHKWRCLCGNIIEGRMWSNIKRRNNTKCKKCVYNGRILRYKTEVEKTGEYEYIKAYFKGDILPNGKTVCDNPYIQVKHKYCGSTYEVIANNFINKDTRCSKCCGSYEKSFAYYIEQELRLDINDVWDFEKNIVSPYHISKNSHNKVYIKCKEKYYHGSYKIRCSDFYNGIRCSYCYSRKIHPLDSFGQHLKENNLLHLWSDKNTIDPFTISRSNDKKIWMLCDKHDYHNDYGGYEISCAHFINLHRCSYCASRKIHHKDSFGYLYPNKAKCWHEDNDKSPYEVSRCSDKKYKFICEACGYIWSTSISAITNMNSWCPQCSSSKGERRISEWLRKNNIKYESEKVFRDLLSDLGNPLRYDFYLPDYNTLIEYDGLQHDKWIKSWVTKDKFERTQYHDKLKNRYAENNNIKLIRIREKDFENIEDILEECFKKSKEK